MPRRWRCRRDRLRHRAPARPSPPEAGRAVLRLWGGAEYSWSLSLPVSMSASVDGQPDLARRARLDGIGVPSRLVEFENALGGRDIEPAEFTLEIRKVARGDAVVLCGNEQHRHGAIPRKVK